MILRQRWATAATSLGIKWFCMLLLFMLRLVRISSSDWVYQESSFSNYFQSKNIMGSSKPEHNTLNFYNYFCILSTRSGSTGSSIELDNFWTNPESPDPAPYLPSTVVVWSWSSGFPLNLMLILTANLVRHFSVKVPSMNIRTKKGVPCKMNVFWEKKKKKKKSLFLNFLKGQVKNKKWKGDSDLMQRQSNWICSYGSCT